MRLHCLLFGDRDPGLLGLAVDNELFADMVHGNGAGLLADFLQHGYPGGAVIAEYLDLDQFMRLQAGFNLFQDLLRQAVITYHHYRMQVVAQATQKADLFGIQLIYLVDSKRLAV